MHQRNNDHETPSGDSDTETAPLWLAPTSQKPVNAIVPLPGSKSLTGRELVLSALADGTGTLTSPLHSRDSQLMIDALSNLGTRIEHIPTTSAYGPDLRITPAAELTGSTSIFCGLAGTVMRFVPAIAALALGPIAFDGDPYARTRPMRPLINALRDLGADIADEGRGSLPFTVHGRGSLRGGRVEIDASLSSQFVSALLLSGARFEQGVHVVHTGKHLPSQPHIDMTIHALRARGVTVTSPAPGQWQVLPGTIAPAHHLIEADLSNAAPFLAAAVTTGGKVRVPQWPASTTQVGDQLKELLKKFGAHTTYEADGSLSVCGSTRVRGVTLNIPDAGELAPTLIGLAALAAHGTTGSDGEGSIITGIGHIRHHETDRIAALVTEIRHIGGRADELADGIQIHPATLHGGQWNSYADHRMATTGALIGLRIPGIHVENIACTSKTMPQFTHSWERMITPADQLAHTQAAPDKNITHTPLTLRSHTLVLPGDT